jgi:hypothetical protein
LEITLRPIIGKGIIKRVNPKYFDIMTNHKCCIRPIKSFLRSNNDKKVICPINNSNGICNSGIQYHNFKLKKWVGNTDDITVDNMETKVVKADDDDEDEDNNA